MDESNTHTPKHIPSVDEVVAELRKHDAAMTTREWQVETEGDNDLAIHNGTDVVLCDMGGVVKMPSDPDAEGIAYLRNHASLIADLLAEATERERVLREAAEGMLAVLATSHACDWREENEYACDECDYEGCTFDENWQNGLGNAIVSLRAALPTDTEGGSK